MTDLDPASQVGAPPPDAAFTERASAYLMDEARASVALDGDTQSEPDRPAVDSRLSVDRSSPSITPKEIVRRIGLPVTVSERGWFACPVCNMDFETPQALGPHFRLHWQEAGVALKDIPNVKDKRVQCPECKIPLRSHSMVGHLVAKHQWERAVATGYGRTAGFDLDAYLNPPPPAPKSDPKAKKPKPNYEERQQQFVVCPNGECGAVHRRKYMIRHIQAVHDVDRDESIRLARALPASRHTRSIQSKLPHAKGRKPVPQSQSLANVEQPDAVTPPPSDNAFAEAASTFDFTAISPNDIAIGVVQSQLNGTMPTALLPDVIDYVEHTRGIISKLRDSRT